MMWIMGRIGSSGKPEQGSEVRKPRYGDQLLHIDRRDRFGLHKLKLPTHLSLKRACSLHPAAKNARFSCPVESLETQRASKSVALCARQNLFGPSLHGRAK